MRLLPNSVYCIVVVCVLQRLSACLSLCVTYIAVSLSLKTESLADDLYLHIHLVACRELACLASLSACVCVFLCVCRVRIRNVDSIREEILVPAVSSQISLKIRARVY